MVSKCGSGSIDRIFWRNWLFLTSGPNRLLGGSSLVELLRESASVGQSTLTHFYSLHTFVLPLLNAVFMLMHFPMIRKQCIAFISHFMSHSKQRVSV
ncbi:cytochrome b6 [Phtheirospermum japonicum]|uniref:Cytochrome b6 n=1 Tax=Phtheirospermum japonicum TaxID=374723 RepID=A0A830BPF1_9LAMI|nr:cytochrome b6 [Phtheirospermum japonicum]